MQDFLSKLSRGLMLPIALLPIAGIFLGVGAGFANLYTNISGASSTAGSWAYIFTMCSMIGDVVFGNLPVLFAIGIAIAFTNDIGVAALAAFVGWIIFNATQSTLIFENLDVDGKIISYDIGFWKDVPKDIVGTNVGITSMQTSAFGGILIGFWAAFMYNRFYDIQLPKTLGFFQGSKFVPIITFLTSVLLGLTFIVIWPPIGYLLNMLGTSIAGLPFALDSALYGGIKRALIPFGLHHVFYTPLWFTSAGGTMTVEAVGAGANAEFLGTFYGNTNIWFEFQAINLPFNVVDGSNMDAGQVTAGWTAVDAGDKLWGWTNENYAVTLTEGVNPGAYQAGAYPLYMAALPAAGFAMIMASDKDKRQVASSVIMASILTVFLTGITEPIEFTFLFVAPWLYYGFNVPMAAVSFWLAGLMNAHVAVTFSQGIFDFFLFGILPVFSSMHNNVWSLFIIAAILAPIYYFFFYFAIKKFDVKTPGRGEGEIALVSKAEYREAKNQSKSKGQHYGSPDERKERVERIIEYLGGMDNLTTIDACASRLRLTVVDREKVNVDGLTKDLGAPGVVGKGTSVQVVFGGEAEVFKNELRQVQAENKA